MSTTLIAPPARLSALVRQLADQWRSETQFLSSTTPSAHTRRTSGSSASVRK